MKIVYKSWDFNSSVMHASSEGFISAENFFTLTLKWWLNSHLKDSFQVWKSSFFHAIDTELHPS